MPEAEGRPVQAGPPSNPSLSERRARDALARAVPPKSRRVSSAASPPLRPPTPVWPRGRIGMVYPAREASKRFGASDPDTSAQCRCVGHLPHLPRHRRALPDLLRLGGSRRARRPRISTGPAPRRTLETPRAKNLALGLLAVTQFVIVIDASIVNVALPSIGKGLDFSRSDLSWVVNTYTLTFGGFLLLGGRLADLVGRAVARDNDIPRGLRAQPPRSGSGARSPARAGRPGSCSVASSRAV
jgi:hypothetical protein